ncbi:MAG: hypothetical protein ACOZE5_03820 [Verrucomicrobiota bacterium]
MSLAPPSPSSPSADHAGPGGRRWESWLLVLALALIGIAYYFALPASARMSSRTPQDYYGLQTDAFLSGQLHLKIATDPRLLTLENPYAGPQGASRPHDMSYYHGRFYLYYGVTPVLLLFLPWRLVTGTYLAEALGAVVFLYASVLLASVWLVHARRRWFPSLPFGWVLLLVLTIGFSPPLFSESTNNTFYGVPIAGAVFCLLAAFTAAERALAATTPGRQAAWLAAASQSWGLAVGSRPIYVLGLTFLALPAVWLWWRSGQDQRWRWPGLRLLLAAVAPAAVVGLGLMAYNYLRFDSPFDFGIRYSMASGDLREARLVGPEFIPKNLRLYLLEAASFVRYHPFVLLDANAWGLGPHLPFTLLGLLFPLTWLRRTLRDAGWIFAGVLLAGAAAANLGLLCLFFGEQERYLLDFTPPLLLLAATTALALLSWARSRLAAWSARILISSLAAYAIATGCCLAFPRHALLQNQVWLERLFNYPAYFVERQLGVEHGPLELELEFPRNQTGMIEPLVTTGYGVAGGDSLAVRYIDADQVQFRAFHIGRGGPASEPVRVDFGVPHRVRIHLGSLYPPRGHPLFAGWPPARVETLRRRLRVELDGQTVLQGNFPVYPSTPAGIQIGRSDLSPDVSTPRFTGRILHNRRLGLDPADAAGYAHHAGPVRLTLRFPTRSGDEGLPLVATGETAGGDLVFAQLLEGDLVRFGHDSFGAGAIYTPTVPYDPGVDQVVEIEMASLYPAKSELPDSRLSSRLRIAFNGSALLDTSRPFNPAGAEEVEFGFNTIHASTAIEYFPGAVRSIERLPPHPFSDWRAHPGDLRLTVRFPAASAPVSEPLVVTGRPGRGDVLFVRYEEDGAIRFGHDHWGVGADLGERLLLDRSQVHLLVIRSASLGAAPNGPAGFEVSADGKSVFRSALPVYPAGPQELALGENSIGASSSNPQFTGAFLLAERVP